MIRWLVVMSLSLILQSTFAASLQDKQETLSLIKRISNEQGIDYRLIVCVIQAESNFDPYAVSHKGAQGLMQIMPGTQKELGIVRPFSKQQNISGGVLYLIQQIKYFGVRKGLWAYNTGPGNVRRGKVPRSTKKYANKIIRNYWKLYAKG